MSAIATTAPSLATYFLLVLAVLTNMAGHVSFKFGAMAGENVAGSFLNPYTFVGFATYGFSAFAYIAALRTLPLSVAMPTMVLGYFGTALFAHYVWGEPFGVKQVIAFGCVGVGLYLLHS